MKFHFNLLLLDIMHKAKACIISCMDFRFHDQIQKFLKDQGYLGHSDEIAIAGGSRDFIFPVEESDGKYIWKQLGLSIKLHDPDEIVFIDHQDCGGYAQDGTIPNGLDLQSDRKQHQKFFEKLKLKINQAFPGKKVSFYHAALDGEIALVNI